MVIPVSPILFMCLITNTKFDEKEFEIEREIVLNEIKRYDSRPAGILCRNIPKSLFGESDYGDPIGGYEETIKNIEKSDLEEFKQKYYVSNNMFVVVNGNIKEKHKQIIEKYFSKIEEGNPKKKKPTIGKGKDIEIKFPTKLVHCSLNFEAPLDLRYKLLTSIVGYRGLMNAIFREKYGICYSCSFYIYNTYPDRLAISLELPGIEKQKLDLVEIAKEEFFEKLKQLDEQEYKKAMEKFKLDFMTSKYNLYLKTKKDLIYINYFGKPWESIYKELLNINYEELKELTFKNGKKVIVSD
ncbi:NEQ023 [Nanoarchaeum equitans Kin4-M]|uniref:NEQ023 n=1 Tax=Nanoarchaeum equitans (strain Kin4-M) TaxID=228908 RepID=Q74N39_NANEQ|nr:NEQ023 [Nanoarchaeum equitans Kin4-M]